ncbi:30S ribosome-binding factor RbfA [Adlercreutzia aquisgranensis]|uniref:30S ribosome-binding factor RbfA n=1 Tax=Adlercreutzia aquisgranensis TaxID=2941323 RepID=UPI00203DF017|nr:30S ribosome-binding factor RbfA [Adlercreutzia aquisgranensis]
MKQSAANRKVNERAREIIAHILLFEISDPRLDLVTVTGCEVSYDRSVCNVFYTTEPERYDEVAAAFKGASGAIRSLMAKDLEWRVAPELRFLLDKSVDNAERIAQALINDPLHGKADDPTESDVPADADPAADERAEAFEAGDAQA